MPKRSGDLFEEWAAAQIPNGHGPSILSSIIRSEVDKAGQKAAPEIGRMIGENADMVTGIFGLLGRMGDTLEPEMPPLPRPRPDPPAPVSSGTVPGWVTMGKAAAEAAAATPPVPPAPRAPNLAWGVTPPSLERTAPVKETPTYEDMVDFVRHYHESMAMKGGPVLGGMEVSTPTPPTYIGTTSGGPNLEAVQAPTYMGSAPPVPGWVTAGKAMPPVPAAPITKTVMVPNPAYVAPGSAAFGDLGAAAMSVTPRLDANGNLVMPGAKPAAPAVPKYIPKTVTVPPPPAVPNRAAPPKPAAAPAQSAFNGGGLLSLLLGNQKGGLLSGFGQPQVTAPRNAAGVPIPQGGVVYANGGTYGSDGRDYGADPGQITAGLQPGERVYDFDTNSWGLK